MWCSSCVPRGHGLTCRKCGTAKYIQTTATQAAAGAGSPEATQAHVAIQSLPPKGKGPGRILQDDWRLEPEKEDPKVLMTLRFRAKMADSLDDQWVLPPITTLLGKRGPDTYRPTMPVAATKWKSASEIRRWRLAIQVSIPVQTARMLLSSVRAFGQFLEEVARRSWDEFTSEDVADFCAWRRYNDVREKVEGSTVASDISRIRSYALIIQDERTASLMRNPSVTSTVRTLGGADKQESVRKTPVSVESVDRVVQTAEAEPDNYAAVFDAIIVTMGIHFFMRFGEFSLKRSSLGATPEGELLRVWVTFFDQKNKGGPGGRKKVPQHRHCTSSLLQRAWKLWWPFVEKLHPGSYVFRPYWGSNTPLSPDEARRMCVRLFGPPPVLPGEEKALPWSLRSGGASWAWGSRAVTNKTDLCRLGRWRSEVGLDYVILHPAFQSEVWKEIGKSSWPVPKPGE